MSDQKILDKIKKLLALSTKNGATEAEAESAMAKAASLAARHNIDLASAADSKVEREAVTKYSQHHSLKKEEIYLHAAASTLYNVRFLILNGGRAGYQYIGTPTDCELAEATFSYLNDQMLRIYKLHLANRPGMTQKERGLFRDSFKQACSLRVQQRAVELMKELETSDKIAQESVGHNALVVAHHFQVKRDEIELYLKGTGMNIRTSRMRGPKSGTGTSAGYQAGNAVRLRQSVS